MPRMTAGRTQSAMGFHDLSRHSSSSHFPLVPNDQWGRVEGKRDQSRLDHGLSMGTSVSGTLLIVITEQQYRHNDESRQHPASNKKIWAPPAGEVTPNVGLARPHAHTQHTYRAPIGPL